VLVDVLNSYLDETCRIVLEHGGTIDKIVGDALHVMFNAPSDQPDHARRAVRCAIALDKFCQSFVEDQVSQGVAMGITRIGVNTGTTVVGNFGGASRFDYTAHGDAINTAARLESVNKHLGTRLCVSETTRVSCGGVKFRPIGELVLAGKAAPLAVFEPVHDSTDATYFDIYEEAYEKMGDGDNAAALELFEQLSRSNPDDPMVRFHLARLRAGEDGVVIVMAQK
jgi:adenylate cyclase